MKIDYILVTHTNPINLLDVIIRADDDDAAIERAKAVISNLAKSGYTKFYLYIFNGKFHKMIKKFRVSFSVPVIEEV